MARQTGPFGQYSLFAPRDGTLLDVIFYDPKSKGFGLISADVAGATLFISGGPFDKAGTIAAVAAGSRVTMRANPFTNSGTIQELNGGKVLINP